MFFYLISGGNMFEATIDSITEISKAKVELLNASPKRYFVLSMLAGMYVGFGVILIFAIGAPLNAVHAVGTKALMGASFGVALSLVIFAGSELFTGNNLVMTIGGLNRRISWFHVLKLWVVCWLGNLAGSLLLAYLIFVSGLADKAPVSEFVIQITASKMNTPWDQLFFRGILCNILVCLAVWLSLKLQDDTAKLILIFWCLFAFIGAGFEHSVANMTLLGVGLFISHPETISWLGFFHNLIPVTLGNIVGGAVFVGAAYWYIASGIRRSKLNRTHLSSNLQGQDPTTTIRF
jgi:nitrite transporter